MPTDRRRDAGGRGDAASGTTGAPPDAADQRRIIPNVASPAARSPSAGETRRAATGKTTRRKLRPLIISMGGERQEQVARMFESSAEEEVSRYFELPVVFTCGVSSRALRNRYECLKWCHAAGLLPQQEWDAIEHAMTTNTNVDPNKFFDCLQHVPIDPSRRRRRAGANDDNTNDRPPSETSQQQQRKVQEEEEEEEEAVHYSIELWRKAKGLNRGRSVLACLLAHLIALSKMYPPRRQEGGDDSDDEEEGVYDFILEDNVRTFADPRETYERIWSTIELSRQHHEQQQQQQQERNDKGHDERLLNTTKCCCCHLRYYGWLGSIPNLRYIYERHEPTKAFCRRPRRQPYNSNEDKDDAVKDDSPYDGCPYDSIFPFPTGRTIQQDLAGMKLEQQQTDATPNPKKCNGENRVTAGTTLDTTSPSPSSCCVEEERGPGGNAIWGCYAYWVSREGYERVLQSLRSDVGAFLWKNKRGRHYLVKPIDKILPRQILRHYDNDGAICIPNRPAFFRAPMLTSKIHAQFDPEFFKSTQYQLQLSSGTRETGRDVNGDRENVSSSRFWNDLWLTETEQRAVAYYQKTGQLCSKPTRNQC